MNQVFSARAVLYLCHEQDCWVNLFGRQTSDDKITVTLCRREISQHGHWRDLLSINQQRGRTWRPENKDEAVAGGSCPETNAPSASMFQYLRMLGELSSGQLAPDQPTATCDPLRLGQRRQTLDYRRCRRRAAASFEPSWTPSVRPSRHFLNIREMLFVWTRRRKKWRRRWLGRLGLAFHA